MKIGNKSILILTIWTLTFFINPTCAGMPGMDAAGGGDKKDAAGGNTVNVISQNAVESSGNATQSFLDRLERRETITRIRNTIEKLGDRLDNIKNQVENRLNQINASGKDI